MTRSVTPFGATGTSGRADVKSAKLRRAVCGVVLGGGAIVASVWMVATLLTLHTVVGSMSSERPARLDASLGLKSLAQTQTPQRLVRVSKFSRLKGPLIALDATASAAPQHTVAAVASVRPVTVAFAKAMRPVHIASAGDELTTGSIAPAAAALPSTMASALVDPSPTGDGVARKPFSLVLAEQDAAHALPDLGPLPMSRPRGLALAAPERETTGKPRELAYAKPEAPALDEEEEDIVRPAFRGRKGVAYYDISAGVVHMPNGEKLEAHSGIGKMRDNPDFVHVTMRGPTPPGTYKVTMRESLFHGVEAVRLTPTNGVAPHGRVGLLAHSYLLRKRGDSHGCVAFADYPKFLKAFKRGEISQMVIVKSMKGSFSPARKTLASLFSRDG